MCKDSPRYERLFHALGSRGLRYGREDSFKLSRHAILENRVLVGVRARDLGPEALLELGAELGMPKCYESLLRHHYPRANDILLGLEDRDEGGVFKVYLECWDDLKARALATGSLEPALLHLGVKWDTQTGKHCRADYICYPFLSVTAILGRVERIYGGGKSEPSHEFSMELIRGAAARCGLEAAFLYLEASEAGSPRKSFDVNLYNAEMTVEFAQPQLIRLAAEYALDGTVIEGLLGRFGNRVLGHLSAGMDRHGRDYATIYYEISLRDDRLI